jgi:hypothetical protein
MCVYVHVCACACVYTSAFMCGVGAWKYL